MRSHYSDAIPTPKFIHDCHACRFLGTYECVIASPTVYDLYFCRGLAASPLGGSVIARFSDHGPDYASLPVEVAKQIVAQPFLVGIQQALLEALKRADALQEADALEREAERHAYNGQFSGDV